MEATFCTLGVTYAPRQAVGRSLPKVVSGQAGQGALYFFRNGIKYTNKVVLLINGSHILYTRSYFVTTA